MSESSEVPETSHTQKTPEKIAHHIGKWQQKIQAALDNFLPDTPARIQRKSERNREKLHKEFPNEKYCKPDFDLTKELQNRTGAFVEVAGPTLGGYALVDTKTLPKKMYISNITPGVALWDLSVTPPQFIGYEGKEENCLTFGPMRQDYPSAQTP